MAQYIDKSAVVAEIDRLMSDVDTHSDMGYPDNDNYYDGRRSILVLLRSFLDTLEVKGVDLQSEIDRVWDNTSDNFSEDGWKEFEEIAKHFFELGMAVGNKAKKGE